MKRAAVDHCNEQFDIDMNSLTVQTRDTFASLLEFAANNDADGFKQSIEHDLSGIDEIGLWYGRKKMGSKRMILDHRTPLMVASIYGSVDVVKLILSLSNVDVNRTCGLDKTTALHCAASGGSENAVDVVKLLLEAGANRNLTDTNGHFPVDVIVVSPKLPCLKLVLEEFLRVSNPNTNSCSNSPPLTSSPDNRSVSSNSDSVCSPKSPKYMDISISSPLEKKEYPIDPSLPDIKNGIFSTDEFRMFSFKIRPCSRAYSHDWTECPFVHPGENARRRDPRRYHYSSVPCPEFRKGACRRGDTCEYAHGVFECWLHPAQYRTRLCKDGTSCNRRVCFFAHKHEELRPLYVSTGSTLPSPRSSDFTAMTPSLFSPPMSPSGNGVSNMGGFQSSRLRSSLNARDILVEDLELLSDYDMQQQLLNELSRLSQPGISSLSLTRPNLEDFFSADSSSPRYSDQGLASSSAIFSPTHKSAVFNQFHNANFTSKSIDHPLLQGSFAVQSPGRMSPRIADPISVISPRVPMQQRFRSLSSHDLCSNSAASVAQNGDSWSQWGSSNGKPDWTVNAEDFGRLQRSSSFELGTNGGGEEPDLSWVQSLVKETPHEAKEIPENFVSGGGVGSSGVARANAA